jgi:hypothetical protein
MGNGNESSFNEKCSNDIEKVDSDKVNKLMEKVSEKVNSSLNINMKIGEQGENSIILQGEIKSGKHLILDGQIVSKGERPKLSLDPFLGPEYKDQFGEGAFNIAAATFFFQLIVPNSGSEEKVYLFDNKTEEFEGKSFILGLKAKEPSIVFHDHSIDFNEIVFKSSKDSPKKT